MSHMPPNPFEQLPKFKASLKEKTALKLDDTPRYSAPYSGKEDIDLTISPREQILYRENRNFSQTIYSVFNKLLEDADFKIETISSLASEISSLLTPPQEAVFRRIADRIITAVADDFELTTEDSSQLLSALRDLHYLPVAAEPHVSYSSFGTVILTVDPKDWFLFDPQARQTKGLSIPPEVLIKIPNQRLREHLSRSVILLDQPEKELKAVRRHELFHDLYKRFISPEQRLIERDIEETRIFSQFKEELIAYALQGRWQYFLANLSLDVRLRAGNQADSQRGCINALGSLMNEAALRSGVDDATRDGRVDDMVDMIWLNLREVARLHYSDVQTDEIKGLLCAQSFKELLVGLRDIGDRRRLSGAGLYHVLTRDITPDLIGELSSRLNTFVYHEFGEYRLPRIKDYQVLIQKLESFVQGLELAQPNDPYGYIPDIKGVLDEIK